MDIGQRQEGGLMEPGGILNSSHPFRNSFFTPVYFKDYFCFLVLK
jgi:hypothetical protein